MTPGACAPRWVWAIGCFSLNTAVELANCNSPMYFSGLYLNGCFTKKVRLETQVVRRCKALQAAAWQRHARFEATKQVRSNCVFQDEGKFSW